VYRWMSAVKEFEDVTVHIQYVKPFTKGNKSDFIGKKPQK